MPRVSKKDLINSLLTFSENSEENILLKMKKKSNYILDEKNEMLS